MAKENRVHTVKVRPEDRAGNDTSLHEYLHGRPALVLTLLDLADHYVQRKAAGPARDCSRSGTR